MKKSIIVVFVIFILNTLIFSQTTSLSENRFHNRFGFTLGGGINSYVGDFPKSVIGYMGNFGTEFYFLTAGKSAFGIKILGDYGLIGGKTNNSEQIAIGDKGLKTAEFKTYLGDLNFGIQYILDFDGFSPYLFIGGNGLVYSKVETKDGVQAYQKKEDFKLGGIGEAGFKIFLSENITLNLSAQYTLSGSDKLDGITSNKKDNYFAGFLGFTWFLGSRTDTDRDGVLDDYDRCPNTPFGIKVDDYGCPFDSDGDGVYDYLDKCPNTPAKAKVDANGCPLDSDGDGVIDLYDKCPDTPKGAKVNNDGCMLDTDGDGVIDLIDKCPDTPKGVKVDKTGCPIDSDGDGVADYLDKCPDTPEKTEVDANGCPIMKPMVVPTTFIMQGSTTFEFNKSTLTSNAKKELQKIAEQIKKDKSSQWRIEGHTDNVGSTKSNLKLSTDRAKAVLKYLIDLGVQKAQLSAIGLGKDFPVASNNDEAGRQRNRRVVITKIK